jgi:hypothetical protein
VPISIGPFFKSPRLLTMPEIPGLKGHMSYDGHWQLEAYKKPPELTE